MLRFGYGPETSTVGGYGYPWIVERLPVIPEREYAEAEALRALNRGDRCVRYLCNVLTKDLILVGQLAAYNMGLDCNANEEIPTSMRAQARIRDAQGLDWPSIRLQPVMQVQMADGAYYGWPLGVFVPIKCSESHTATSSMLDIDGYDMTVVVYDDKLAEVLTIEAGTPYANALTETVMRAGVQHIIMDRTDATLPADLQFDMGTSRLAVANALLKAINYAPLHADPNGYLCMTREQLPYERQVKHRYEAGALSVLQPELGITMDSFSEPNVIIAVVSRPDAEPLTAKYINNDPASALSVYRRGRHVVRVDELEDISGQDELDAYVRMEGYKTIARYGQVNFSTLNMPGHGVRDIVYLSPGGSDTSGRYMETSWSMRLQVGESMQHTAQRVVTV